MRELARSRDGSLRMAEVPRVVPFVSCRDAGDPAQPGDGMTLDGFASVFNATTVIDSWEGRFKEQFLPGSMKRSFRDQTPIIQFDHGRHPMIGSLPVARFEAGYPREETDPERAPQGGARVLARMHSSPLFEPVREVISTGTVNGMSIRFGVTREKWYRADGSEIKNSADLETELLRTWMEDVPDDELIRRDVIESRVAEMGPVVFPAYTTTSVGVRSMLDLMSADQRRTFIRDIAAELRRDPGELTDLLAASVPLGTDGEADAERQAVDASTRTTSRRQRADDDALRLAGIIPARKAGQS